MGVVTSREGVEKLGGMSETSAEGTTHSVLIEEQVAFANWINVYVNMMQRFTLSRCRKTLMYIFINFVLL